MSYDIRYAKNDSFLIARVTGDGDPSNAQRYYADVCKQAAEAGHRRVLVDSHTSKTEVNWTFDDAEQVATAAARAALANGILAIAVVSHDPASNRDAENFAVQVFKNHAVEGKYFSADLAAASAWIANVSV